MRPRTSLTLLALAALAGPGVARANGRFPASGYVVVGPGPASSVIALRTTFGLVTSYDAGRHWGWTCEEAFRGANGYDPSLAVGFDGAVVATVPMGISIAPAASGGCAWSGARGAPVRGVVDIAVDASGRVMFSATGPTGTDDTIYRSTDGGATWEARAMLPGLFTETVEVAPSDPSRVYVSGFLRGGIPVLYRSDDGGGSVREVTRDFGRGGSAFISGVDPTNPDVVYVRSAVGFGTILLRSTDGGATLREIGSTADIMAGFALSDDGTTVWMGSSNRREGILRSVRGGAFRRVAATVTTRCLRYHAGILYVCADEAEDGFLLGSSGDEGEHVDPLLSGRSLLGVSDRCDRSSPVSTTCNDLWPPVRMTLAAVDAGAIPTPVFHDAAAVVDAAADAPATDVALDAPADVPGDAAAEAGADVTGEVTEGPDAAPDAAPDVSPDVTPDAAPDVAPDVAAPPDVALDAPDAMDAAADAAAPPDVAADARTLPPPPSRDCACRGAPADASPAPGLAALAALGLLARRRRGRARG
ncbi:MAG: MYXO-CTERM sorting domain-containing protein [Polyangiales bacterium]